MSMESTKSWKQRLVAPVGGATASLAAGILAMDGGAKFEIICGFLLVGGSTLVIVCGLRLRSDVTPTQGTGQVRHRQSKEMAADMPNPTPPRHISTLPVDLAIQCCLHAWLVPSAVHSWQAYCGESTTNGRLGDDCRPAENVLDVRPSYAEVSIINWPNRPSYAVSHTRTALDC